MVEILEFQNAIPMFRSKSMKAQIFYCFNFFEQTLDLLLKFGEFKIPL